MNLIYETKKGKIKRIGTKLLPFRESLKKKKQKTCENNKERLPEWAWNHYKSLSEEKDKNR